MKTRKLFSIAALILVFSLACTQPINLTEMLSPVKDSLREFFELLGLMTDSIEMEEDKGDKTVGITEAPINEVGMENIEPTTELIPTDETSDKKITSDEPTGKIIYVCQVDNTSSYDQICMVNADGTGFKQLTNDVLNQFLYPSWTPDGKSFVFSGSHSGIFKIYEMNIEGDMQIIGDIEGELYAPMVSPDGTKIVFTRHISEEEHYISVVDRDGSNLQDLTAYYDAQDPVWSPDGSMVLFSSLQEGEQQFYFMNADGTNVQKISGLNDIRGRADWSVDFAIASFSGTREEHNREIVLVEVGSEKVMLTDDGDNLSPSFSPDGQWITFMSYRDHFWESDGCEIYIMRKDGTDIRRLTDNTYCDYQPRWSK